MHLDVETRLQILLLPNYTISNLRRARRTGHRGDLKRDIHKPFSEVIIYTSGLRRPDVS